MAGNKLKNWVTGLVKNAKGDEYTGKAGIPQEASKGMSKQDARDAQYAATHQGEVVSGKIDKNGKTGSNPSGKVDLNQIASNIADTVDTAKTAHRTGKTMTEVEKEKRAKEKREKEKETAQTNQQEQQQSASTSQSQSTTTNTQETQAGNDIFSDIGSPDYDLNAKKALEANGLGKYVKEDGSIDYNKLEKSKVGWKVLQGLGSAMAAFGSGMTGANFDASNGFASQELAKRQEVQDAYKETAQQELDDQRGIETFAKQLKMNNAELKEFNEAMLKYKREDRVKIFNYIKALPVEQQVQATKILAQSPESFQEALASAGIGFLDKATGGAISGIRSDEKCKHFAKRSVFK